MKYLKIAAVNIFILIICIFICDILVYRHFAKIHPSYFVLPPFSYQLQQSISFNPAGYFDGSDNLYKGRTPDGLEYTGKKPPILILGCSFAHGQYLDADKTLSARLAQLLHRPVYNRAAPGKGLQHMLYQTERPDFYAEVPPADTVIYLFINDHYRRMKVSHVDMLDTNFTGNYKTKNGRLVMINSKNPVKNLIKSSYTVKLLNQKAVQSFIYNEKNADKLTDEVLLYFLQMRDNLEYRWGKTVNFIVLLYDNVIYDDILIEKLQKNVFQAYSINDDIAPEIDLQQAEYTISKENIHPNERVWRETAPLIIKKLNLK